jgi:ketosteroid isomerase-like protein
VIRQAFHEIFAPLRLHVQFDIDEVEVLGDAARACTHSSGKTEIHAAGITVPERNSELFILRKPRDGEWRIAPYLFATQNPPKS